MKLSLTLPICLGFFVSLAANCQVATPSVGYVRYANDGVRGIYGLEGNYIVGRSVLAAAETASFSDAGGLIYNSGSLVLADPKLIALSTTEIEGSEPIVRLDGGVDTAIAWVPSSHVLVHWNGKSFVRTAVSGIAGEDAVTSVRKLDPSTASLFVLKPDSTTVRYRVSLQTGELESSTAVPNAFGYAFESGDRVLCFKEGKLSVLSHTGETLQMLPVPADSSLSIAQVSSRCLHLSTKKPGQDWLLHLDGNDFHLYRLPAPKKGIESTNGGASESAQ